MLAYELRGITVEREYAAERLFVWGDGGELNQVWTNLLDNTIDAVKTAAPPEPRITMRTAREHNGVVVAITDNGTGIPPDVGEQIFEPFVTTKGVDEGTGLGLDISYRIVVGQHQGDLWFTSSPGETTFQLWQPTVEKVEREQDQYNGDESKLGHDMTNTHLTAS